MASGSGLVADMAQILGLSQSGNNPPGEISYRVGLRPTHGRAHTDFMASLRGHGLAEGRVLDAL